MFKRASTAFAKVQKVTESTLFKQQALAIVLRNTQKFGTLCAKPKHNQKFVSLNSFSRFSFSSLPSHTKLSMPALSPTMEQGNIGKWNVKIGDKVSAGDQICDIETDKATLSFEVQDEGYIAAILVGEGTKGVTVGTPIVILVDSAADVKAFTDYKEGASSQGSAPKAAESKPKETPKEAPKETKKAAAPKASFPTHTKVAMPALSPTMETGKITQWTKKVGDKVDAGETIANVETDKATIDFVYQDEGYIAKLLIQEGEGNIKVGQIVCIVVDSEADVKAFANYSEDAESGAAETTTTEATPQQTQTQATQQQSRPSQASGDRTFASPLAKKTAGEQNIDISQVEGTGPNGRVLKHNVDEFVQKGGAKAQAAQPTQAKEAAAPAKGKAEAPKFAEGENPYTDIPLTTVREVIAKRLLQSKTTIPHYYLETEVYMDEAIKIRGVLNESAKTKLSFNDLFIKAASLACIDVPEVNSQWHGNVIRRYKNADISVAVDTGSGLITPIVFAANTKGLNEISQSVKDLADKAKKNALKPHEFQGGTFSISNLGMFGTSSFAAVINPPQAAILAVGKTDKKVISVDGGFKAVSVMNVTLSCDHRVVDGAVGAKWLERFKSYLEKPYTMLL